MQRGGGAEKPPSDANVFADFGGGEHTLSVGSWPCLNFKSVRKTDGEKVRLDFAGGHAPDAKSSCPFREDLLHEV